MGVGDFPDSGTPNADYPVMELPSSPPFVTVVVVAPTLISKAFTNEVLQPIAAASCSPPKGSPMWGRARHMQGMF